MVNERGLRLIAEFEGFSPVPYEDPVGHCTVGYGELLHLGKCTAADMARAPITEEEGLAALADKVVPYAEAVLDQVTVEINENQLDALASLCYNVGPGGIRNVVRAVNTGGDVCAELRKIIHGTNGVVYPGLVRRREAECVLYNTPMEDEDMMKIAAWWTGRKIPTKQPGEKYEINLFADFGPAKAYDLRLVMAPGNKGAIVFKHGDFRQAGIGGGANPATAFMVIPGAYGTAPFDVLADVEIAYLACAGVIP